MKFDPSRDESYDLMTLQVLKIMQIQSMMLVSQVGAKIILIQILMQVGWVGPIRI